MPTKKQNKTNKRILATISEDFDADLVDPAFQAIKASGQAPPDASDERIRLAIRYVRVHVPFLSIFMGMYAAFSDERIRLAIRYVACISTRVCCPLVSSMASRRLEDVKPKQTDRQANYDADAALVALLGGGATAPSHGTGTTFSPPRRPSSASFQPGEHAAAAAAMATPVPQRQEEQQQQQYAFPTALRPSATQGGSTNPVIIIRAGTPDAAKGGGGGGGIRGRTPPPSKGGGGGGGGGVFRSPSPQPPAGAAETGVVERLSMGSPAPPQVGG